VQHISGGTKRFLRLPRRRPRCYRMGRLLPLLMPTGAPSAFSNWDVLRADYLVPAGNIRQKLHQNLNRSLGSLDLRHTICQKGLGVKPCFSTKGKGQDAVINQYLS